MPLGLSGFRRDLDVGLASVPDGPCVSQIRRKVSRHYVTHNAIFQGASRLALVWDLDVGLSSVPDRASVGYVGRVVVR
jgi:hypothetical protein